MSGESEIAESALRFLRKEYEDAGETRWEFQPRTWVRGVPDAVIVFEWSRGKSYMIHTIEAKTNPRTLVSDDKRRVSSAVSEARQYPGNYRWLVVSHKTISELSRHEEIELKRACRRTKRNLGLLTGWKTKSEMLVRSGYWPGYWLNRYENESWLAGWSD